MWLNKVSHSERKLDSSVIDEVTTNDELLSSSPPMDNQVMWFEPHTNRNTNKSTLACTYISYSVLTWSYGVARNQNLKKPIPDRALANENDVGWLLEFYTLAISKFNQDRYQLLGIMCCYHNVETTEPKFVKVSEWQMLMIVLQTVVFITL